MERYFIAYLRAQYGSREEENLWYSYLIGANDEKDARQKLLKKGDFNGEIGDYDFEEFHIIR